jgi:hypothetical protein
MALTVAGCGAHQAVSTAHPSSVKPLPAQAGLPAGSAAPAVRSDVYAYVPEYNGATNTHPAGEGALQLRSADTGRVLRTLLRIAPTSPVVSSSGRYVYYTDADNPKAPSGTVSTPYRIPLDGGTPQRLPLPTYDGKTRTEVTTVIPAPDDRRFAYACAGPIQPADAAAMPIGVLVIARSRSSASWPSPIRLSRSTAPP